MTKFNEEILKIANLANLIITVDENQVEIKHKFQFETGNFILFSGGHFLSILSFVSTSDITIKIIGIILGLLLSVSTLFSFIFRVTNKIYLKTIF